MVDCSQYLNPTLAHVYGGQECWYGPNGADPGSHTGILPFTGLEIGTFLVVGVFLVTIGWVLRRESR
jgi:hypothetical protein